MNNIINASSQDFEQHVLRATTPVIVDFWAPWCGPCKALAPVLEEIASDSSVDVRIVKVDSDEEQELAARYGVRAIPTLLFYQNGSVVGQHVGLASRKTILERLRACTVTADA